MLPWRFLSIVAILTLAPLRAEGPDLHLPPGFRAEVLYTVPKDSQGSWVALCRGAAGELYASDQAGAGIFRITPAAIGVAGAETKVEPIGVELSGAQGLVWAFDSLYANVYGKGLWRVRDTDGDGRLDDKQLLIPLGAGGEHGPHAVLPTADGRGLYFIGGNHVAPPKFDGSCGPTNWAEDLLLPRLWDARGHARGILAPGGWIARCDPDGSNVELISTGYRNQYDIALDAHGELFTYDADMEWDLGTPWYRPTRVCHVTSGSEFGWRSGTGKWPAHYEDSLPAIIDLGPGSPTGITFGTGARFPERYQRALFVLDWTFGTIYALHLEPVGASFKATKEEFAWAKPLGVTDAVIGADGAMYFTVGGRGTQSALYRVTYVGDASTAPAPRAELASEVVAARSLRHQLEAFHGRRDPAAVAAAWPHLGSADRHVRFAARIAVEAQPVAEWRARALAEEAPRAAITALIALARQGEPADLDAALAALARLPLTDLSEVELLGALRAHALALIRLGKPSDARRTELIERLDPLFPARSAAVNRELGALLIHLGAPTAVEKSLALLEGHESADLPTWATLITRNDNYGGPIAKMLADMPPLEGIHHALNLRNATVGWDLARRRQYFGFFPRAAQHPGGMSYTGFLENIRADAVATLDPGELRSLASELGQTLVAPAPEGVTPPTGPGRAWTMSDALAALGDGPLRGRNFEAGRNLFHATSCSTCHRFDGGGGAIGPDLSTVANKFSAQDLLEAILEPSKVISDQYAAHTVLAEDGTLAEGLLAEDGDELVVYTRDPSAPPVHFARSEVKLVKPSPLSQMPAGLVDPLNPDELRDLLAYLLSGGNSKAPIFAD